MHTCYSKLKLNYSAFFLFSQYLSNFNVKKLFTDKSQGPNEMKTIKQYQYYYVHLN